MLKRFFSFILAVTVVATLLSACGNTATSTPEPEKTANVEQKDNADTPKTTAELSGSFVHWTFLADWEKDLKIGRASCRERV